MAKVNPDATPIEQRDPHAAWWTEHHRLAAEHENRYVICGEEANEKTERRYRRLAVLEDLLRNTPVTTFEGARVQLMALDLAIEDGLEHDDLMGVLSNLNSFMDDIEGALERHQLKEQVQRWCWEERVPSAPTRADDPATGRRTRDLARCSPRRTARRRGRHNQSETQAKRGENRV